MNESNSNTQMSKYAKKAILEINEMLKELSFDCQVSVLDFTHFTNLNNDDFLLRFQIFGDPKYLKILDRENEKYGGYALFKRKEIRYFCNLGYDSKLLDAESPALRNKTEETIIKSSQLFDPNDWHKALINEKFGGCSIIYSRRTGNDLSAVYLILNNKVGKEENGVNIDFTKQVDKSDRFNKIVLKIFKILDIVLIDELSGNLHAIWEKANLEKQKIEVKEKERDLIFRKLFHSQKQHLALLSYLAKEVEKMENIEVAKLIEYSQKSLSEFLDINKYITESEFTKKETDLVLDLKELINVFQIITSNKDVLSEGIRLRDFQYSPIVSASIEKKLFNGNFNDVNLKPFFLPIGIPKLIFKEIIVNAIQHSKWDEPSIQIEIEEFQYEVVFNFSNNVTKEMVDKLNKTISNNNHGRDIINSLSEKIGWTVVYLGSEEDLTVCCSVHIKR